MISTTERADRIDVGRVVFENDTDKHPAPHPPTLNEIQIRAYRIHQTHGAVYGGYSIDDWLEAEQELNEELRRNLKSDEQVH